MLNKSTELFHKTFTSNGNDGWIRGYELRQLGVNYRGSPLILDQRYTNPEENSDPYRSGDDGSVRAGDRAPDAPGLVGVSSDDAMAFFDIFKPSTHTVIVFTGNHSTEEIDAVLGTAAVYPKHAIQTVIVHPKAPTVAFSLAANYVLVDRDGHAYKNYVVSEKEISVVVIRPDSYIGALVFQPEDLKSYFTKIFL